MALSLTPRDRILLSRLSSFGVLSSRQMDALCFPGVRSSTVLRRLRKLRRAGFIERATGLPCGEHAWHVTKKGGAHAGASDAIATVSKNTLEHAVFLSDVRIMLEQHQAAHGWIPEHELKRQWGIEERRKNHEFTVVPDGLFAAIVRGETRIVSLELELHAKGRRLYRTLFDKYPKHVPIWKLWYVVSDPKTAHVILEIWQQMSPHGQEDWIVWSKLSDIQSGLSQARVHSVFGSLPVSKWITIQGAVSAEKQGASPAQPPALPQSTTDDIANVPKIRIHEGGRELSASAEISNSTPPGQHSGEHEGGSLSSFQECDR